MAIKTPYVAVDGIIKVFDENENFKGIVLIERKNPPYGLALPGGFVDVGESVEEALIREMKEETNLDVEIVKLFNVYSKPDRDPRFHTVSIVFLCKAYGQPIGKDDAKKADVYRLEEIPFEKLVFDHGKILKDFLNS
ncbi:NUDIX domain-containing protein [Sulfurihydrogenibium azorense]|jgi:8-oxo-dGTP diphosphatase|uniref:Adp-ribose pyrophosphatase (Adp-ribose diphosphatase)(Adenosine diphosphoribose pyrophosphatase) (Adpr-ppase) (Adp-ribosephosphohydrolase) n=1 Tax=Sulfurihydrogenibium azorense (strain DSM 15241 / OCM 825 / Az-Fu1) TaxID=204536 RepID=C1DUL0_SULAA|nr:NUDIX hydrolase [Sulfurihydrogenibium azorense]ACN98836.1 adp-ribose pyrophosphatase (adp-ribose diphosphatase)(adenosine diphosphoribose pyrophosphatase) (adpr-ppase) (adp-ribosephosphohydrolase) [Sulfurihydrogenibium azorense Az-Fu1]MDM7273061.1 NUDIX hydrolase [Sulfurihydrogenibium azorense]